MSNKVAVVTGSNKGIGLAIVKRLCEKFDGVVYLTSRDESRGWKAVGELNKEGLQPEYHQLDVTDRNSIEAFRDHLLKKHGGLDILINNAGIANNLLNNVYDEDKKIIDTNYKSILVIEELIFPIVKDNGRILNISSNCGHLSNLRNKYWIERLSSKDLTAADVDAFVEWFLESSKNGTFKRKDFADRGTLAAYKVAKVALSARTMLQQKNLAARNISVNSIYPGIVRTAMTAGIGFYTPEQSAVTPVYLVLDAPESLKGAYVWCDGTIVDWFNYKSDHYFKSKELVTLMPSSYFANLFRYLASWFGK